jgi:hypothetical protein
VLLIDNGNVLKTSTSIYSISSMLLFFILFAIGAHWISQGYLPVPLLFRHLYHLAIETEDFHNFIVKEDFKFYEEGYTKGFPLKPEYLATYCLEFILDDSKITSRHETFKGELKVDLFCKNKLLFTKTVGETRGYGDPSEKYKFYKVYLADIDIPFDRESLDNLVLRVTVINPDAYLEQFTNSIKLCVGVKSL